MKQHKLIINAHGGAIAEGRRALERRRRQDPHGRIDVNQQAEAIWRLVTPREPAPTPALRAPHWSVSALAMRGSIIGRRFEPGEISLAHGGVLVLDDVDEFSGSALDAVLGAMLGDGTVEVYSRAFRVIAPADFILICGTQKPDRARSKLPAELLGLLIEEGAP